MKTYKVFLLFSLIVATSLLIIGCGVLTSGSAVPEEVSGQSGELPVWLSAAHYEATATDALEDDALDDDFFLGQSSDPSESTATQTPVTQQSPTGTGTAPTTSETTADSEEEKDSTPPAPGTMAYIIWQKEQREAAAEQAKKEREKAEEKDKTLQERVWEMTYKSLSPSVDVEIKTPGSDQGQQGFDHMFDLN